MTGSTSKAPTHFTSPQRLLLQLPHEKNQGSWRYPFTLQSPIAEVVVTSGDTRVTGSVRSHHLIFRRSGPYARQVRSDHLRAMKLRALRCVINWWCVKYDPLRTGIFCETLNTSSRRPERHESPSWQQDNSHNKYIFRTHCLVVEGMTAQPRPDGPEACPGGGEKAQLLARVTQ